tara:strand:+ start:361 stop:726 length:366 start_codon:yes stop_codon:yes gene_type:complete
MKKTLQILIVVCLFLLEFSVNAQNYQWAKSFRGSSASGSGTSIDVDALGNVYTTGYFLGTVDFDPGVGVFNLTSNGSYDIFICKLDASGNFVWGKGMGAGVDLPLSTSIDSVGNIYYRSFS